MKVRITERKPGESARDYAFRVIKDNIVALELAPGSMLSENEIAEQLGLSRTPVREALIDLNRVKVVEVIPQRGSRISLIDYALVEQARFLRLVVEEGVCRLAASLPGDVSFSELDENLKLQRFYLDNPNPAKLFMLDNEFHALLFRLAGKPVCYEWLQDGIIVHFDRVRSMSLATLKEPKIVEDHQGILDAVKGHDATRAAALMSEHLSRYRIDEKAIKEKYPSYFLPSA